MRRGECIAQELTGVKGALVVFGAVTRQEAEVLRKMTTMKKVREAMGDIHNPGGKRMQGPANDIKLFRDIGQRIAKAVAEFTGFGEAKVIVLTTRLLLSLAGCEPQKHHTDYNSRARDAPFQEGEPARYYPDKHAASAIVDFMGGTRLHFCVNNGTGAVVEVDIPDRAAFYFNRDVYHGGADSLVKHWRGFIRFVSQQDAVGIRARSTEESEYIHFCDCEHAGEEVLQIVAQPVWNKKLGYPRHVTYLEESENICDCEHAGEEEPW
jgi:hypothetical protein